MKFDFSLDGLPELRAALRQLPNDLKIEATKIVIGAAHRARAEVIDQYPEGETGNLQRGVTVRALAASSQYGARMRVSSRAKHVHFFEAGTKPRHTKGQGPAIFKKAYRGFVKPANGGRGVFIPTMIDIRRLMERALIDLVRSQGLEVRAA